MNLKVNALTFEDTDAAVTAYEDGLCDAVTSDRSHLAALRTGFPNPGDHLVLTGTISEEPLGPMVPHDHDHQWFDIVKTVMAILINAEAYGIASDRAPDMPTCDSDIGRLLGFEGSFGQAPLGLGHEVARDVILAVGNYGDICDRHLGVLGVGLAREGSRNALWDWAPCTDCPKGGQIYAPPLRQWTCPASAILTGSNCLTKECHRKLSALNRPQPEPFPTFRLSINGEDRHHTGWAQDLQER